MARSSMNKLILSTYEQSVCRVHFVLVGEVISFVFVLMATIVAATSWYHYSLPAYALLATVITFFSAWTLRIRFLVISCALLFIEVAFKLVGLIVLSHDRITIYNTCYLTGNCEYDNWRIQMVQLANGIAFLFPSILISFINMVSVMYLIYLFRSNNRQ